MWNLCIHVHEVESANKHTCMHIQEVFLTHLGRGEAFDVCRMVREQELYQNQRLEYVQLIYMHNKQTYMNQQGFGQVFYMLQRRHDTIKDSFNTHLTHKTQMKWTETKYKIKFIDFKVQDAELELQQISNFLGSLFQVCVA